jgi:hypothetical protein
MKKLLLLSTLLPFNLLAHHGGESATIAPLTMVMLMSLGALAIALPALARAVRKTRNKR